MTDKKQPDALAFCWATELAMTQQPVTLSVTEAREVSAEMQRLHAENTALRQGYAAARLEIESLRADLRPGPDSYPVPQPAGEYPALPVPVFESWAQGGLLREAGFTADQMRAYVDADRAMRAAQPAPENIRSILARCRDFIDTAKAPAYPAGADLADEIDALLAAQPAPQQKVQEPVAWMTQEGDRVVTEKTMNAARRGGGAMLTSLHSYSVALVRAAAPQPSPAAQVDALEKLTFTVEESNG